jgi:RNA methyltransferase, TrmH family
MLSKARIKFIKSLQIKKYRKQEQCFMVQGAKSVQELLKSDFETELVVGTPDFLNRLPQSKSEILEVSLQELGDLGEFQTNDSGLAVARIKPNLPLEADDHSFMLALDDIRDPGNLGTIIRTADWYGIKKIVASAETADFYNPKVIGATMGSFTRVSVFYTDLSLFFNSTKQKVYGAYLDGDDIHKVEFEGAGVILIGNEAHGISENLTSYVTNKITIPRYGEAESLNAAIATAIICDNVMRQR